MERMTLSKKILSDNVKKFGKTVCPPRIWSDRMLAFPSLIGPSAPPNYL